MKNFQFFLPTRVLFGEGEIEKLGKEAKKLGKKALLVTGRTSARKTGLLDQVMKILEAERCKISLFDQVEPNPSLKLVEEGGKVVKKEKCEVVIGMGGGSSMDAAKAIALLGTNPPPVERYLGERKVINPPLPLILIPTTSGTGSEVTPYTILTLTEAKPPEKRSIRDPKLFPQLSILDPELTLSLPPSLTRDTGLDAFSHAVEGFLSLRSTPLSDSLALEVVRICKKWLPVALREPKNKESRAWLLYGACLGGMVIAHTGSILVHGMGYRLTLEYGISHGRANAFFLPGISRLCLKEREVKLSLLAQALGEEIKGLAPQEAAKKGVEAMENFFREVGFIPSLRELKVKKKVWKAYAKEALGMKKRIEVTPHSPTQKELEEIYRKIFEG